MATDYTRIQSGNNQTQEEEHDPELARKLRDKREAYTLRQLFLHVTLVAMLIFVWLGFQLFEPHYKPPPFNNYVDLRTIDAATLDLHNPNRRIMMVGDLHGMVHSLDKLLDVLKYNSTNDLFMHLGDISTKGPHSNEMITRFAAVNMTGVRGNNDQKVIDWHDWFEWVKSQPGGDVWLESRINQNTTPKQAKAMKMYKSLRYTFPKDWDWGSDEFRIARALSPSDYAYLASLPIVIHMPSLHTFMVHAGIVPLDPQHHMRWKHQPLANLPKSLPKSNITQADIDKARYQQESAMLTDIKPNTDPFIKLNIRDVHDLEPVQRGPQDHDDNEPWSDLWNRVIKRCHGFGVENATAVYGGNEELVLGQKPLPCYPMTVVYSHASGRGLDLKRWSKGLDTGCVNGEGLTTMILGKARRNHPPTEFDEAPERDIEIKFGEDHKARLVSIACPTPPPIDD